MKRLTNKKLIKLLLPFLEEAKKQKVKLTNVNYYGEPYHSEMEFDEESQKWIYELWVQRDSDLIIMVYTLLKGKYDVATLSYRRGNPDGYSYSKEYKGMGNGFYADVDFKGNIIKSEWD